MTSYVSCNRERLEAIGSFSKRVDVVSSKLEVKRERVENVMRA